MEATDKTLGRWKRQQEKEGNGSGGAGPSERATSQRRRRPADKDAREEQKRRAPATKGKGSKRKHDGLAKAPSSGDGGGAGGAAPPPASASRAPGALADEDKDGAPVNGDTSEDGNVKELLSVLVRENASDHFIAEKIKILSQRYTHFRRIRADGNGFYRALLFSYLENLGQLKSRQAEATRLMECVATYKENMRGLELDKAYFSNPEFSSVITEFNGFVKSVAKGLRSDELFKRCLKAINSRSIISLLRLLAYKRKCPKSWLGRIHQIFCLQ